MASRAPISALCATEFVAAPAWAQDPLEGAVLYADLCSACHGADLRGEGPMAPVLTVPPADLTRLGAGADVPTLAVARQIDGRDPMAAHGGEMPLFGPWVQGNGADVAMTGPGGQPILMARPIANLIAFLMEVQS